MTYEEKIARAETIVSLHNSTLGDSLPNYHVDFRRFRSQLQSKGGTTDGALQRCSWELLEQCGLPQLLAQQVADVFRARDRVEECATMIGGFLNGCYTGCTVDNLNRVGIPMVVARRMVGVIKGVPAEAKPEDAEDAPVGDRKSE